jgi:hypothetical protein
MSEDTPEYNAGYKPKGELRFIRLRSIPDDVIGYVTYNQDYITVELPLRIEIETLFDEGRQILAMQEYLPQAVVEIKEVDFNNEEVLFATPVKADFVEQYEYVADFFYNNTANVRDITGKKQKPKKESPETQEKIDKVVSILEALQAKKDKPVH